MKSAVTLIVLSALLVFCGSSCKKDKAPKNQGSGKYDMIAGSWAQKDLVLAVPVKLGGQNIPAGTSIITLAPLLGPAGQYFTCTKNNVYNFNKDSTMQVEGCTDLILPVTGKEGTWRLDIYDAVLLLKSKTGEHDPHWINEVTKTSMKVSITAVIPKVATVPLTLILEKK